MSKIGASGLPDLSTLWDDDEDEPTLRMQNPLFCKTEADRDTIPSPPPEVEWQETRYPGVGLVICLVSGIAFWSFVAWLLYRG